MTGLYPFGSLRNWNDVICLSRSAEFARCVVPCRLKLKLSVYLVPHDAIQYLAYVDTWQQEVGNRG